MNPSVWPVTETFVAEIGDLDLSQPLSEADWQVVEEAFETYAILIIPDQRISQQQHIDFALRFGPMDASMVVDMTDVKPPYFCTGFSSNSFWLKQGGNSVVPQSAL